MRNLYTRLALSGIRRSRTVYLPYLACNAVTVAMFFILNNLTMSPILTSPESPGAYSSLWIIFRLSCIIFGLLCVVFIAYASQYSMKIRISEWGIYSVLGFNSKDLRKILLRELILLFLLSTGLGIISGAVFTRMAYLLLENLSGLSAPASFLVQSESIAITVLLFAFIYGIQYVRNSRLLKIATPLDLLRVNSRGEQKPRFSWFLTLIGIMALVVGYALVFVTQRPTKSIFTFFVAILMVLLATFCLFVSGITQWLLGIQNRKPLYRKTNIFAVVPGLLHRMKRNAVGMASLCILSCAVLVTVITTFGLYVGTLDMLKAKNPYDFSIFQMLGVPYSEQEAQKIETQKETMNMLSRHNLNAIDMIQYDQVELWAKPESSSIYTTVPYHEQGETTRIWIYSLEDYNEMEGLNVTLNPGEALMFCQGTPYILDMITIEGVTYQVRQLDTLLGVENNRDDTDVSYQLIVPAPEDVIRFADLNQGFLCWRTLRFNIQGEEDDISRFIAEYLPYHNEMGLGGFHSYHYAKQDVLMRNGGYFFLGLFFGVLFVLVSTLVIYYKQLNEGNEDRQQFYLMQKVGMSWSEVQKAIRTQMRFIFFFPLIVAIIHTSVAFVAIKRALVVFGIYNPSVLLISLIASSIIYFLFYYVIYRATSKTYNEIVKWEVQ